MALPLFHHHPASSKKYRPHPHAHHVGMLAAIVGLLSIPLGPLLLPSLLAIILGTTAILLSLHPAPGLNARPEGWVAIAAGLFGLAQILIQINL